MYAIAIIIMFGLLATLMPFAVLPALEPPVQTFQPPTVSPVDNDVPKKDNIEQYILSMCNRRKVEGKVDIYPSCVLSAGCTTKILYYSDMSIDLTGVFGWDGLNKTDGSVFSFKPITAKTCDASEFVN